MIIVGWGGRRKVLGTVSCGTCPHCMNDCPWEIVEQSSEARLYFVPIARWSKKYYVACSICSFGAELASREKAQNLLLSELESRATSEVQAARGETNSQPLLEIPLSYLAQTDKQPTTSEQPSQAPVVAKSGITTETDETEKPSEITQPDSLTPVVAKSGTPTETDETERPSGVIPSDSLTEAVAITGLLAIFAVIVTLFAMSSTPTPLRQAPVAPPSASREVRKNWETAVEHVSWDVLQLRNNLLDHAKTRYLKAKTALGGPWPHNVDDHRFLDENYESARRNLSSMKTIAALNAYATAMNY
ncbi:zinc-ribbon domain-containing protein [Planctomyces sp. SH-PL14]|uniref:zinc-ribbon domain-containing protein n=1 Tax=Planctomyces sp. SH-PL14 TaxID=1632864 RepID=UPI00078C9313|nr:zinc-ribbon domain-containing protein [Planctomyces sp. SH-PL14]AMV16391.1 hypothetical protein VT03_00780 [Planctomyces sp. SH-PL14]